MQYQGIAAGVLAACLFAGSASAVSIPFVEDFSVDVSNWEDAYSDPLSFSASGGPDGGSYATTEFNYLGFSFPFGGGPVVFRANDSDNASGDAFVGNWISSGVAAISIYVRHDAPVPLTYFLRVATGFNFPGAVIASTQPVAPNTWTQVMFPIAPDSPLCTGETVTCLQALQNVANFQIGTSAPAALTDLDEFFTLDLDKVQVVPEPVASLQLAAGVAALVALARRRMSASRTVNSCRRGMSR